MIKAWARRWLGVDADVAAQTRALKDMCCSLTDADAEHLRIVREQIVETIKWYMPSDKVEEHVRDAIAVALTSVESGEAFLARMETSDNPALRDSVRRWVGLDGPGGLADVLMVKDAELKAVRETVATQDTALRKMIPLTNDHTRSLQRFAVYERQVPSIKRVFDAMRERAIREQRKRAAEQALAAEPTPAELGQPMDAVLDDVSAEVGGG